MKPMDMNATVMRVFLRSGVVLVAVLFVGLSGVPGKPDGAARLS